MYEGCWLYESTVPSLSKSHSQVVAVFDDIVEFLRISFINELILELGTTELSKNCTVRGTRPEVGEAENAALSPAGVKSLTFFLNTPSCVPTKIYVEFTATQVTSPPETPVISIGV